MQTSTPPAPPEIDDELAALEANAPGAKGATRSIMDAIAGVARKRPKTAQTYGPRQARKGEDRAMRRAMERSQPGYKPDPRTQPHSRVKGKPVKSQAQIHSEFRAAARVQLMKIKLTMILPHCPEVKYIIDAEAPRLRNVWWLSQLDNAAVAAIPGLGPKRRKALLKYLHDHNVPTTWSA